MGRVVPFVTSLGARGDFSAEERARLAELGERYAAAGVRVEVIFGSSEEGDPWCVVKDEAEEVLIHVARIGDTFVVHYALDDALRQGQDLRSVLRERLAWEEAPEVVVPFSRQAQSLLALIVAASFMHETAPAGEDPGPIGPEPADPHLVAAGVALAPAAFETAIVGKAALHAEAASLYAPAVSPLEAARPAIWRDVADETPLRLDHGGVQLAHFAPGAPASPVANLEVVAAHVRAPEGPAPMVMAFDAHPRSPPVSTEASAASASGPVTALFREPENGPQTQSDLHPPPTPERPGLAAAHWIEIEIDTDGDGRPDTRVQVPDEPRPETPEHADHAAILAVGHGLPHAEIV